MERLWVQSARPEVMLAVLHIPAHNVLTPSPLGQAGSCCPHLGNFLAHRTLQWIQLIGCIWTAATTVPGGMICYHRCWISLAYAYIALLWHFSPMQTSNQQMNYLHANETPFWLLRAHGGRGRHRDRKSWWWGVECWRRSSRGPDCCLTAGWIWACGGSLRLPLPLQCSSLHLSPSESHFQKHSLERAICCCGHLDSICDWNQLRPLHKLLTFWQAVARIYSSHGGARQASRVSSVAC